MNILHSYCPIYIYIYTGMYTLKVYTSINILLPGIPRSANTDMEEDVSAIEEAFGMEGVGTSTERRGVLHLPKCRFLTILNH